MTEEAATPEFDQEAFIHAVSQAAYLGSGYPGCVTTVGYTRYITAHIAMALNEPCARLPDILGGLCDDEDIKQLGRAYAAYASRNRGNLYAGNVIDTVLKYFSGRKVSQGKMIMLGILENHMLKLGDWTKDKEES